MLNKLGRVMTVTVRQSGREEERRVLPGEKNTVTIRFSGDDKNIDMLTIKAPAKDEGSAQYGYYERDIIYLSRQPSKEEKKVPKEFENYDGTMWTVNTLVRAEPELLGKTKFTVAQEEPKKGGFFRATPKGYFKVTALD